MIAPAIAAAAVRLRRVTVEDSERVWEWNFAPDVRARSVSTKMVTFAEHERWFARRLADVGSPMWIIEEGRIPVGVLRIDRVAAKPGGMAIGKISIALTARARGRGIGRRAIVNACEIWSRPVLAHIAADNTASRACFEACRFVQQPAPEGTRLITYEWSP